MTHLLEELAQDRRENKPRGIYAVCSAHPLVLEAAVDQALEDGSQLLIEATSNQVNHRGGYTGMQPAEFRGLVVEIAARRGLSGSRLLLGGDHLGPNPWQKLPAEEAMCEAELMVEAYVRAGFQKIHLDASMACGGEPTPLPEETIARRAARLCAAAERASSDRKPVYVIGTEVPVPGGATESLQELQVTSREAAATTLAMHRQIFAESGLGAVWPRVIALVVQPGVEFNHDSVIDYIPARAVHLTRLLEEEPGIVYEAHSTDYQRDEAFQALVRDGFAILKVGPALTFALHEALSALAEIELELYGPAQASHLMSVLERAMIGDRRYWESHYSGNELSAALMRRYSYSDRIRYYWNDPQVKAAVEKLLHNLAQRPIPETMLSAFLHEQYLAVRAEAHAIVLHRIRNVLRPYAEACGMQQMAAAV